MPHFYILISHPQFILSPHSITPSKPYSALLPAQQYSQIKVATSADFHSNFFFVHGRLGTLTFKNHMIILVCHWWIFASVDFESFGAIMEWFARGGFTSHIMPSTGRSEKGSTQRIRDQWWQWKWLETWGWGEKRAQILKLLLFQTDNWYFTVAKKSFYLIK